MEQWLARYVMSSATREEALVRASNLPALHRQLLIGMPGQTVRTQATLEAGPDRYERVIFSTPGLTILDPIAITGSPPGAESDSDEAGSAGGGSAGPVTTLLGYPIPETALTLYERAPRFYTLSHCDPWLPADTERTLSLINRYLSEANGDYGVAFAYYNHERNQPQNCCDLSYAAAGLFYHYSRVA